MNLIITTPEDLERIIQKAVQKALEFVPEQTFTINQVAKILKKSHVTVTKLVKLNMIPTTPDGLITKTSINNYLQK